MINGIPMLKSHQLVYRRPGIGQFGPIFFVKIIKNLDLYHTK